MTFFRRGNTMKRFTVFAALILTACATPPDKIASAYVSPIQYQDYSCKQIAREMERISRRASELHGSLNKTASNDNAQMAVGLILFWPTLFFLEGGDGPQASEYARLKGEREALEQVANDKNCDPSTMPRFEEPPAPQTAKQTTAKAND